MHGGGLDQPHVPVDSAARVPPRGVLGIVEADRHHVALARLHVRRQVHAPRGIAVGPAAGELAVDPDGGVRHRAVDVEEDLAPGVGRMDVDGSPVPADTVERQPSSPAAARRGERPFDTPVVRQVERAPCAVVEIAPGVRRPPSSRPSGRAFRRAGSLMNGLLVVSIHGRSAARVSPVPGDIVLLEPPALVNREALASGRGGGSRGRDGRQDGDGGCQDGDEARTSHTDGQTTPTRQRAPSSVVLMLIPLMPTLMALKPPEEVARTGSIVLLVLATAHTAFAQNGPPSLRAGSLSTKIVIDGQLTETAWESADAIEDFRQTDPAEGAAPSAHTRVQVLADQAFDRDRRGVRRARSRPDRQLQRAARRDPRFRRSHPHRPRTVRRRSLGLRIRRESDGRALRRPDQSRRRERQRRLGRHLGSRDRQTADWLERGDPDSDPDARVQARAARVAVQCPATDSATARDRSLGVTEPPVSDDADQSGRTADRPPGLRSRQRVSRSGRPSRAVAASRRPMRASRATSSRASTSTSGSARTCSRRGR